MKDGSLSVGVVLGSASRSGGGLFTSVRRLSQSLRDTGAAVSVYALHDPDSEADLPAWNPLPVAVFPPGWPRQLGRGVGLGSALRQGGHDLLHQHGIWQGFSASVRAWARQTDRPTVISPRGMLDPWALANAAWKKRIAGQIYENRNLGQAGCLHALNEAERLALRRFGLRGPVAVIANAIDPPTAVDPAARPAWADMVPADARIMLFLGRLHPKKGVNLLLQAMARLPDGPEGPWHLVLAGWDQGGHLAQLQVLAGSLSLSDRVHAVGALHDDRKWIALQRADAFVLPSLSEGMPMAVLEAWACGRPVLMTSACNLPEGAAAGAAIIVDPTVSGLRDGLARMTEMTPGERGIMGDAGRRMVADRFTWPAIAGKMHATYTWLVQGGAPPSWVDVP